MPQKPVSVNRLLSIVRLGEREENKDEILKALRQYLEDSVEAVPTRPPVETVTALEELYAEFHRSHTFSPGDLVVWKKDLKNRRKPAYEEPAIVVEKLDKAIQDESAEPSSMYFREPLDVILGLVDEDGEFICYYFDSRRFRPFKKD